MLLPWGYTERWNERKSQNTADKTPGGYSYNGNPFFAVIIKGFLHKQPSLLTKDTTSWRKAAQSSDRAVVPLRQEFKITIHQGALHLNNNASVSRGAPCLPRKESIKGASMFLRQP